MKIEQSKEIVVTLGIKELQQLILEGLVARGVIKKTSDVTNLNDVKVEAWNTTKPIPGIDPHDYDYIDVFTGVKAKITLK